MSIQKARMKNPLIIVLILFTIPISIYSQDTNYKYEPNAQHPFGLPNPEAPSQIKDYELLIGKSTCTSTARNPDQTWADPQDMTWVFKYIMNGKAVQDETLKSDGSHSGSIRQYIQDSSRWYVHYYSSAGPTTTLSTWEGNKTEANDNVLYRPSKAPNGTDGFYRLTFSEITKSAFEWEGAWVSVDETTVYPTWKISCKKEE